MWDVLSATELVKVTNSPLVIKSGLKSREGYNGVSTVCIFKNLVRLSINKMSNISSEIRVMQRVGVTVLCHLKKFGKLHESKHFSTAATLEASDYFFSGMGIKMNEKGNYFSNT